MTSFMSTTEPTPADRAFKARAGDKSEFSLRTTVLSSGAVTRLSTFSAFHPNWVKMKDGVLLSLMTRRSEKAMSAAVIMLPEWNF